MTTLTTLRLGAFRESVVLTFTFSVSGQPLPSSQDALSRAAASDLLSTEARKLVEHLPNPPETDAQAAKRLEETVEGRRFSGDSARSSEDQKAFHFERNSKILDEIANPSSVAMTGSWDRAGSSAQVSPASSRSGSLRQMVSQHCFLFSSALILSMSAVFKETRVWCTACANV